MSEKAKSPLLILIIFLVISLAFAGSSFFLFQKEHAKNLTLTEELEEIKTRQKITETKLEESKKLISDLELKVNDAQTQIEALNKDLEQEKSAKLTALTQIEQLRTELEQQKGLRAELEERFNQAQKEVEKSQNQLRLLVSQKTELENKISDLQEKSSKLESKMEGVELGKIVVTPSSKTDEKAKKAKKSKKVKEVSLPIPPTSEVSTPPPVVEKRKTMEGKVLVVNKEYNFAVIDLGSKDGVGVDDIFTIYHDNKNLGDARVGKVHDSMSAVDFLSEDIKDLIAEGDKVVLNRSE
jgi:myosin heavy subunit